MRSETMTEDAQLSLQKLVDSKIMKIRDSSFQKSQILSGQSVSTRIYRRIIKFNLKIISELKNNTKRRHAPT
jgi:hypothetical protein